MDRVLVDAPCTGTGVWRRRPDSKWRTTPEALGRRMAEQDEALRRAAMFVKPSGVLAYSTCSLLPPENEERVAAFLQAHPDFFPLPMAEAAKDHLPETKLPVMSLRPMSLLLSPLRSGTDGFFLMLLRRHSRGG
jgi:16S rRNA (cytosine967-C5)-methyltransferase